MEKGGDIWLLTLSDLLMLLTIFFVILFGMTFRKEEKSQQTLPPSVPSQTQARQAEIALPDVLERDLSSKDRSLEDRSFEDATAALETDLAALLSREERQQEVMVERYADRVVLTFPEQIVFDPGQAEMKPSAQVTLKKVASFIVERPHLIVEVQGHTDDQPIHTLRYPSNWELSVDRATQVTKAIIGLGVDPTRLSVKGFGEYRPAVPNDTEANRLRNRRVEIQFSTSPNDGTI